MISGGTLAAMSDDRQAEAASVNVGGVVVNGVGSSIVSNGGSAVARTYAGISKLALSSVFLAFTATKQLLLSLIFLGRIQPNTHTYSGVSD